MKKIYLDSAASTIIDKRVIEVMMESMNEDYGNPSSTHSFGQEGKAKIEAARKCIAQWLNVPPHEIIFTSCGTESNNFILRSCVENLGIRRIISSPLEHKSVLETIRDLREKHNDLEIIFLPLKDKKGNLNFKTLEEYLMENKPTLVSLMHANNEIGNLIDLNYVGSLCKKYNALFHSDTVQTMGHYLIDLANLPLNFATCSAHKLHGPKGVGFVYIKKTSGLKSIITGGSQERNMRAGTENVYGIVGLGKAFDCAMKELEQRKMQIEKLKQYTIEQLTNHIPGITFNGTCQENSQSIYTLISILLPIPNTLVGFQLDIKGIAVSQGSACSSGATTPSSTMLQLFSTEELMNSTTLRISFSHYNSKEDIDALVSALTEIYQKATINKTNTIHV